MRAAVAAMLAIACVATPAAAEVLPADVERALASATYVYVATERRDGSFGTPAEIWFMWDGDAVWVASPPTSWRAKRIRAGRTKARIAVRRRDGPTFAADGAFVRDPAVYAQLCATFAKKYPDGWPKYEANFRDGLRDGSRVLMRYRPIAGGAASAAPGATGTPPAATPVPSASAAR